MIKKIWHHATKSKNSILKGGLILFVGMNFVSFGNYLFNMTMGRLLGPSDYGALMSLMSLLAIISVPATTIQTSAMKFSSTFLAHHEEGKINYLIRYLSKKILPISAIIFIVLIVLSSYLNQFLHIGSNTPLIVISFVAFFMLLLPLNRGVIQGIQNFKGLSVNVGLEPLLKIVFGILLVYLGFRINGAVAAIIIANIIVYIFSFLHLKKILASESKPFDTKSFWHYSAPVLLAFFLSNLLTYIDIIMVKHYFPPEEAGLYSGLSTISKIVLYFSSPFVSAMFPKISDLYAKKEKHYPVLLQTFLIVTLASILITGFFIIFPKLTVSLLFGSEYVGVAHYLGGLSLAVFILSLATVFINYYMAIGKKTYIIFLIIAVLLELFLFTNYHQGFQQIINNLIISFSVLLLSLGIYYIFTKKDQISYVINNNPRI